MDTFILTKSKTMKKYTYLPDNKEVITMYEWSKEIVEKINKSNCLSENELRMVELSLRIYEVHNQILDECIGVATTNQYELQYRHTQKGIKSHENEITSK